LTELNGDLLLKILVAHFISDFILQPTNWAKEKDKKGIFSINFWKHIFIHVIVLCIVLWNFLDYWWLILIVISGHIIIDAAKPKLKFNEPMIFITDQILHLTIIFFAWLLFSNQLKLFYQHLLIILDSKKFWGLVLSIVLLTFPASVLIGKLTWKWNEELKTKGLADAGKWIGIIERLLIFIFIVLGKVEGVGFLLAAKSVFRIGELKEDSAHKMTEYIIIGTFLSFFVAFGISEIYLSLN
jgi:hypothetical protein